MPIEAEGCRQCREQPPLGFDIRFAFQPIVDAERRVITSYEALVRGPQGQGAGWVFEQLVPDQMYRFDQLCRTRAIEQAARLGLPCQLNINFAPNAVYDPALCLRTTLEAADACGFPVDRLVLEATEGESVADHEHLKSIIGYYKQRGFITAIDDFGTGHSGLSLLAEFQPDQIKLDQALIRDIDRKPVSQAIVEGVLQFCRRLQIVPLAEGVETAQELQWLYNAGIRLFQGYYFAKPALEALPEVPASCYSILD